MNLIEVSGVRNRINFFISIYCDIYLTLDLLKILFMFSNSSFYNLCMIGLMR